jgi:hypothetical protein
MARQEGFEVHECEGVGSGVEDLHFALVLSWCAWPWTWMEALATVPARSL